MVSKDAVPFHGGTSGSNPSRSAGESLTGVLHAYGRKRLGFAGSVSRSAREVQNLTFEKFPRARRFGFHFKAEKWTAITSPRGFYFTPAGHNI